MKKIVLLCFLIVFTSCKSSKEEKTITSKNLKKSTLGYVNLLGKKVSLADFKGKKILINYWATWCGPCVKEMPDLLKLQEILIKENYVFLLISDESIDKIIRFKEQKKYDFTFLKSQKSMDALGIYALPTTFIYDENGKVIKKIIGSAEWNTIEMIQTLKNIK